MLYDARQGNDTLKTVAYVLEGAASKFHKVADGEVEVSLQYAHQQIVNTIETLLFVSQGAIDKSARSEEQF